MLALVFLLDARLASSQENPVTTRLPPVSDRSEADSSVTLGAQDISIGIQANRSPARKGDLDGSLASILDPACYTVPERGAEGIEAACFRLGPCMLKPYGTVWTDMIYATSRTSPGFFVLWIQSDETQGENSFFVEARYSRVGIDIAGPREVCGELNMGGRVEVDFLGGFVNENTTGLRLRHVYWEAENEHLRILMGQTWDVLSPLIPNTVSFPVLWGVGNIGFRRAQIRLERYYHPAEDLAVTLQAALAQNINPDLIGGTAAEGVIREEANWPVVEARASFSIAPNGTRRDPITLGLSGHIGETGFDFTSEGPPPLRLPPEDDARFLTWSANFDIKMPLNERLGFQGEFFTGSNLSNQLGGILQGVCPCLRVPIRSTGGWGELGLDVTRRLRTHVGFGIDDPNNADSLIGRNYNRVIYANVFFDVTDRLKTGLEVSTWKTLYQNETLDEPDPDDRLPNPTAPGEAVVLNWTVRYSF